ncbi:DUF6311 domain-containing protein [Falsiroseomonas tokyonensis]|uniref:DUF6311 domain-containing protein n=1 Tax=Falsiroseomonas tokyonensis TaxID=430521 RepID=A0ABV7BYG9_9PROT|nr:DUF6311 domain-containing protein [Falsiroseomonas tokyonensis]MBU8540471.1 hypothetical protein [Falsiroseomonas tokyonensis]
MHGIAPGDLAPPAAQPVGARAETAGPPAVAARPGSAALGRAMALAAIFGGALAAIATLGPRILDIHDLGWLLHGTLGPDPVAYLSAWMYFAPSPWSWPPGLNPDYGLELSSAIFYVDAVPLMAFLAKALRPLLEIPQYWGPWMVLSAGLQAFFAWRLLGLAVPDPVARALGALIFAWQPLLLNRMGGHFALCSQWALLWALWLCLRPDPGLHLGRQARHWAGCLGLVAMLNPYVMAMCGGLWVADLLGRALRGAAPRPRLSPLVLQPALVLPAMAGALWLAGYFTLAGDVLPMGVHYGASQFDLTAPFDAVEWGRLLPALPGLRHWEAGGSYLGAGAILLLALALALAPRGTLRPALRRHAVLVLALAGMLAFAMSNHVAIGGHIVLVYDLPAPLLRLADMLRASERFFWPLAYASLFAAIAGLALRLAVVPLRWVLAGLLLIQVVDIQAGMGRFRALVAAAPPVAAERLADPFWAEAGRRYHRIRAVPAENFGAHWEPVARFAAPRGLPTDAAYHSRVDPEAVAALRARTRRDLARGWWEGGTLYVLRDAPTQALVAARIDPTRDLLEQHDGLWVFAPNWYAR